MFTRTSCCNEHPKSAPYAECHERRFTKGRGLGKEFAVLTFSGRTVLWCRADQAVDMIQDHSCRATQAVDMMI